MGEWVGEWVGEWMIEYNILRCSLVHLPVTAYCYVLQVQRILDIAGVTPSWRSADCKF